MNSMPVEIHDGKYTTKPNGTKHRLKKFMLGGIQYSLDKTLDGHGGFYRLWTFSDKTAVHITIDGLNEWGHGLSWAQAERKMEKRIMKLHRLYRAIKDAYR